MASFLAEFKERGFFYQCTDEELLSKALQDKKTPSAYIGFDCTASSLHVGNLMQLMVLRMLQKHGVRPIVLIGGATTKIGDPSGKDKTRQMLTDEVIEKNASSIKSCISKFIKFGEGDSDAIMLDNSSWLDEVKYTTFLRDYGKHFSINRMLSFESVKARLEREQNLSFLEFNYMILQAFDFMHLSQNHNCVLQCGGSDQWGNIVSGAELTRKVHGKEVFGLTCPLLTTSSGKKMGKTEQGAIWLHEDVLSPYDYYQFWRNTEDSDVFKFIKIFTDISVSEIEKLEKDSKSNINDHKKTLAFEATKLCHGENEAIKAMETAISVFEKGNMDDIKTFELKKEDLKDGMSISELFKISALCESNGSAKRLIRGNGASLNKERITDENLLVTKKHFESDHITISSGKKKHIRIKLT
jgi:tyrosyl-tRNA synthetase